MGTYLTDGKGLTEMVYVRTRGFCRASVTMNSNRDVQAFFKVTTSE